MTNPAPGFAKHPDHTLEIHPFEGDVKIEYEGKILATQNGAFSLAEADYKPVFYLRADTLPPEMLSQSDHTSWCPFKGYASYFHLVVDGAKHENAVWTYRDPFDEALAIKDYIAIYDNVATVTPQ